MGMVWLKHVGSWQMPRWMTTGVTPLFSFYLLLDVSLKRLKLGNFSAKVAVLHFLSLTFYCTSCFACFVAGKFTSLNLSLMSLKRNFVEEVEGGIMEY